MHVDLLVPARTRSAPAGIMQKLNMFICFSAITGSTPFPPKAAPGCTWPHPPVAG